MEKLSDLPNIGRDTEMRLRETGIRTPEELKKIGAEQAWLSIQKFDKNVCLNRLLGLEGAILGIKKNGISKERKLELKEFFSQNKVQK